MEHSGREGWQDRGSAMGCQLPADSLWERQRKCGQGEELAEEEEEEE